MNGAQSTTKPFYTESTRGRINVIAGVERLYVSNAYPGGNRMSPRVYDSQPIGNTGAGVWASFSPVTLYENTTSVQTIAHQMTFQDPSVVDRQEHRAGAARQRFILVLGR